ncbi:MAG TPA: protein kinase, partial [Planctomycetaceae bacterium]|nr:protein kinase [Planctomycetaceae bacterium]
MPAVACLDQRQIEDFSLGRLAAAESREAEEHLEACPACAAALEAADGAADPLVRSLHAPVDASDCARDDEYERAAAAVKRLAGALGGAALEAVSGSAAGVWADGGSGSVAAAALAPGLGSELTRLRDYRLLRKLGEGGMGTVYKALHVRLDRVVALKVLPPDRVHDAAAVARFEREMRAAGRFDHPAIVRATDAGELDGTHFLVMEYVEGLDLARLVERCGPLAIADACEIIR